MWLTPVSNVTLVPQPGGATSQRPADWLLPPLPRFLRFDHLTAGHQGHRAAGVGVHQPLVPLQVPVAAHGERHDQYLQVKKKATTVKWIHWNSITSRIFLSNSLYSTLLAHKKEHIRIFAAESFSYLMRKVGGQQMSNWRGAFLCNASRITGCLLPGSRHRSSVESYVQWSGGAPWEGWRSWSAALWNVQRSPTHVSLLCGKCKFLTA